MTTNRTWRESRFPIIANIGYKFSEGNTRPNFFVITNNSNSTVYVGVNPNTNATTFEVIVPPYGTRIYGRPDAPTELWFFSTVDSTLYVGSMQKEFDPSMVAQTQEIASTGGAGMLGVVDIRAIIGELPAGTQTIGIVNIGTMPSLTAGSALIGSVLNAGNSWAAVKSIGNYTTQQTAAALWTPTTGKKFAITDIFLSSATAGIITLLDNATIIREYNLAANSNFSEVFKTPELSATVDNVLKITTSAAMDCFVNVRGYEV